ncbi:MAG: 1-acyl-sn-glycerol-3-phosphate acyltransferase [Holosporales bacterium]|jgi:1-acyl-sn-glycerol-3-phosphate acyltransferase|nr:1-acyl-sn-glycerol-3-phosphate acyltransferase [Holosporales bacterium]
MSLKVTQADNIRTLSSILPWIRSLIFNAGLYLLLSVSFITARFFVKRDTEIIHAFFVKLNQRIHRWFCFCIGVSLKVYDKENILAEPAIYAIRHESAWETLAFMSIVPRACFVLKAELAYVPLFGEIIKRLKMIAINRKDGLRAIPVMTKQAADRLQKQFNVMIFPEGTRMASGQFSKLHAGVYAIYKESGAKVVPVALNSGKVWPRRVFTKYPGCIKVKFMPYIAPGLGKTEFMLLLEERIKLGTMSLYE